MKTLLTSLAVVLALALLPGRGDAQGAAAVAEGAKLYGQNCVRCHSARSPMERTDREWVTIVNHMRARANLTRSQARALAVFLQQTNAPEAGAVHRGVPTETPNASDAPPEAGTEEGEDPPPAPAAAGVPGAAELSTVPDGIEPLDPRVRQAVERYLTEALPR